MPNSAKPQSGTPALDGASSQRLIWALAFILAAVALFIIINQPKAIPPPNAQSAPTQVNLALPTPQLAQVIISNPSLSSESSATTWLMEAGNPARSRFSPATLIAPLQEQSSLGMPSAKDDNGSPPVIIGNIVLLEIDKELRALDRTSGQQLWSFAERGSYISPAIFGNLALIRVESNNTGELIALDLQTGTQRWSFTPRRISDASSNYYGGHIGSPLVIDSIAYVSAGKEVYALDAAKGTLHWTFSTQDLVTSSLAAAQDALYISDFRYIYAIDRKNGTLRWAREQETSFSFAPVVSADYVLTVRGSFFVALDRASGKDRWVFDPKDEGLTPAGADDRLAYAKSTTTLYAIDLATGAERWRYRNAEFVSLPAITNTHLFVVDGLEANTHITALEPATGKTVWQQAYPRLARSGPIVVNNMLYSRINDGRVAVFNNQ